MRISGVRTSATSFSRSRNDFARSVIWSKSLSARLYSHFMSWRARKGFSPIPAMNASSSVRVRPSRFILAGAALMMAGQFDSASARAEIGCRKEVSDLDLRVVGAVGTVHDVLFDARSQVSADRALVSLLRIGGAHEFAILRHCVLTFQHLHDHRARAHVL